ncbi:TY-Chap domain-containing protein [Actinomadura opuntiae]|uniref:TY-Chap domain-containing protein n=1 Tax=Actinomadura sp. OS1-43 TaxID=604315 RepID=UPI00255AF551|nr:SseB family protein [Actinomadura sp. OS1-43]MDL4815852.1 SseB family protein [Actinomadura sp. OS1-43]
MLEWSEFARRLGRELAGLDRDTILIVRERDESRHYVQAMREPDRLYAEAVSNNFLDGPLLLTPADEEVMSEAGWRPPADPAPRNWWTELPETGTPGGMRSVTAGDHARLAEVMVTALRDVQGVRRPSDLVYESFHRHGTGLIELLDFGIDIADPSRVSKRRSSAAITPQSAAPEAAGPAAAPGLPPATPLPATPPTAIPPSATPPPAGPPPAGPPMPVPPAGAPGGEAADLLEARLAEAKERGDHSTYFSLLAGADLVLPATGHAVENPDRAELPTITIGSGTYVTLFTSPGALARTGDQHPLYRRTTFALLAASWPDPSWQLAVNPGLPSEVLLDASALARLEAAQRETPATGPYSGAGPDAAAGPGHFGAGPASPVSGPGMPGPSGVQGPVPGVNGSSSVNGSPAVNGIPGLNGATGFNGLPGGNGRAAADDGYDDSGTAIDPYTAEELRAALEAGTPDLGRAKPDTPEPEPATAAPLGAPTDGPPPTGEPPAEHQPAMPQPGAQQSDLQQPDLQRPDLQRPDLQPGVTRQPEAPPVVEQQPAVQPVGAQPASGVPQAGGAPVQIPMQPPHGTRLWRSSGEDDEVPVAVYDAIGGVWSPARTDAVPGPRAE